MLLRIALLLAYLLARLVWWVCSMIGKPFRVGGLTIAAIGVVGGIALLATAHLAIFDESGAQPVVLMVVTYPILAALLVALIVRWRTYDPDKERDRWANRDWGPG